ncbi:hypothetical protein CEXT_808571 [Caerostris extrusa]|uniref:Uncharacterized protein n=1 Tax=Caerostris extrusa TaxID=172846 RepID=A0AAV4SYM2_CAEEX|nr:hypothetical protein CEXT_808571 [Caerostris extrusa]
MIERRIERNEGKTDGRQEGRMEGRTERKLRKKGRRKDGRKAAFLFMALLFRVPHLAEEAINDRGSPDFTGNREFDNSKPGAGNYP